MGKRGVVREVTAAGVVVVSTGSGSLRLREKGGFVCFYFCVSFSLLSILSPVVFSHIDPSSYIHSPLPIYFCTPFLFIYLPIRSASLLSVFLLSYSYSTSPYSSFYLSIFIRLSVSVRAHECLSLGVRVCVGAHVCWRVCVRAFFLCLFYHCRRRHLNGLWMKEREREREREREGKKERKKERKNPILLRFLL